MEHTPLPTLLMRTVIQALGSYPRLSGFVMNILQRLILKQVCMSQLNFHWQMDSCLIFLTIYLFLTRFYGF